MKLKYGKVENGWVTIGEDDQEVSNEKLARLQSVNFPDNREMKLASTEIDDKYDDLFDI